MALSTKDRLAIMDRLSRYNLAIDNFLPDAAEAWADCFTDDGTFRAVTRSGATAAERFPEAIRLKAMPGDSLQTDPDALISLSGRQQLRAFAASSHTAHAAGPQPNYHWVSNPLIEGDGDRATTTSYLRVVGGKTQDLNESTMVTGIYRDQLRKVDGQWKFQSRQVRFDD
jgi:hypothetical protein